MNKTTFTFPCDVEKLSPEEIMGTEVETLLADPKPYLKKFQDMHTNSKATLPKAQENKYAEQFVSDLTNKTHQESW